MLVATAYASTTNTSPVAVTTQLPTDVRPTHYDLTITPHAQAMRFDGHAVIALDVLHPTTSITLNALDLDLKQAVLSGGPDRTHFDPPRITLDKKAQTATFAFPASLPMGHYQLSIDYAGVINTQAFGLFAVNYQGKQGSQRALYTQFENADARRFFPCWDEPAYKATFALTVTVPKGEMAVSNMPVAAQDDVGSDLQRVRFAATPPMSTYLLFFGLGDFERISTRVDGTDIGLVAPRGSAAQGQFALASARAILPEYNTYFGLRYPLPKLDIVLAPGSSSSTAAMENWGAILSFEDYMLLDPTISSETNKSTVFNTLAHEMAHLWFGDLVTMRWWDNLWLNEGFANWMALRATSKLHPEWEQDVYNVWFSEGVMEIDAQKTTHPIIEPVTSPEQGQQAFDSITYAKGEALIVMLEHYIGEDAWRRGLQRYIAQHAYGNTVFDDLWQAMAGVTDQPIAAIAHDFTTQAGVPLLRVSDAKCQGGQTTVQVSQGEFSVDQPDKAPGHWRVPVIAQVIGQPPVRQVVVGNTTLQLPGCGALLVNAGQSGYYHSLYAPPLLAAINANFQKLSRMDQMGELDNAWALSMAGMQPVSEPFELIKAASPASNPMFWWDVTRHLYSFDANFRDDATARARYRRFATARLEAVFAQVGWLPKPGELASYKVLRTQLIVALGTLGDARIIAEARQRFLDLPSISSGDLRQNVLYVIARQADADTWNRLLAMARSEKAPLVRQKLYQMLALPEDEGLATRALNLALTPEIGNNGGEMFTGVSFLHPELAFDFAVAHRAQVDAMVGPNDRAEFYPDLAWGSNDAKIIERIQAFAAAHIAPDARSSADLVINMIGHRAEVRNKQVPQIDAWLKQNGW
ncbi:M1 family metallopeptidase [Dyella sp. 7MK23]|uniref:Aminopeptidase n=2 Tax=Dyella acidiphila TaxID=2775866 RepID=A0ABR9G6M7_9GAMM|nr:M1 family metallopeptidase [Dyella acidiphila]